MGDLTGAIIIGLIIGTIIATIDLVLYFKYDFNIRKNSGLNCLSPLAILVGIIYGFFDE